MGFLQDLLNIFRPQPTKLVSPVVDIPAIGTPPTPQPTPYVQKITVPSDNGPYMLPPTISQALMNNFDDIHEATNAARVLIHPRQITAIGGEQRRGVNVAPNIGENPGMRVNNIDIPNPDGSIDRGLFRNNNSTFADMAKNAYWRAQLNNRGVNSWSDLNNPDKSAAFARTLLEYSNYDPATKGIRPDPNYRRWYAAPRELRAR